MDELIGGGFRGCVTFDFCTVLGVQSAGFIPILLISLLSDIMDSPDIVLAKFKLAGILNWLIWRPLRPFPNRIVLHGP